MANIVFTQGCVGVQFQWMATSHCSCNALRIRGFRRADKIQGELSTDIPAKYCTKHTLNIFYGIEEKPALYDHIVSLPFKKLKLKSLDLKILF